MNPLLLLLGLAGLAVFGVDVLATTTGSGSTTGSGPLTARISQQLWAAGLALHRRRPSHRFLHAYGLALTVGVITAWIVGVWVSWTLVFASVDGSVVDATTTRPTDLVGKAYFAGYSILTLGNGELVPSGATWRLTTLAAAGTGLGLVTLAVTYILNVVQAGNRRRSLATMIWSLGRDADELVNRARREPELVGQQLWSLVDPLALVREQHVAFPVLHYLHAVDPHRALPVQAAHLVEAVERLQAEATLSPSVLEAASRVLDEYGRAVAAYEPGAADDGRLDPSALLRGSGWDAGR